MTTILRQWCRTVLESSIGWAPHCGSQTTDSRAWNALRRRSPLCVEQGRNISSICRANPEMPSCADGLLPPRIGGTLRFGPQAGPSTSVNYRPKTPLSQLTRVSVRPPGSVSVQPSSLPAPPFMMSFQAPPRRTSLPPSPKSWSRPRFPNNWSA